MGLRDPAIIRYDSSRWIADFGPEWRSWSRRSSVSLDTFTYITYT